MVYVWLNIHHLTSHPQGTCGDKIKCVYQNSTESGKYVINRLSSQIILILPKMSNPRIEQKVPFNGACAFLPRESLWQDYIDQCHSSGQMTIEVRSHNCLSSLHKTFWVHMERNLSRSWRNLRQTGTRFYYRY